MRRHYPLLRLTPEQAGKLQHDHNRALVDLAQTKAELTLLEQAVRTTYGSEAFLTLRSTARNTALAQQLKQEIAA